MFELLPAGGAPDSVVSDFNAATRQDVLEEPPNEFNGGKRDVADLLALVVAVVETDLAVVDGFNPAVGDGDAEYVTAEIVENLLHHGPHVERERPSFSSRRSVAHRRVVPLF